VLKTLARVGAIAGIMMLTGTSLALAGTQATPVAQENAPPADFGSPPSGQIPILYNDHHVYTKPDILKQGRVLAALVRGGTIFIPLRSMFEQMGGTVSYDPSTKTATVTKPGAEVQVTVGKPEVIINGESRPLDVPPIIYKGDVLVPVRVISESMGAYVQWVPDRRLVVVRYIPATPPPPAPPPPAAPPPPPAPAPTATPPIFTYHGQFRSYYFTRQNATNNPGTQFDYAPGAKYNSNAVNQASWNNSIAIGGNIHVPNSGWGIGATYFYANAPSGPCTVPANNASDSTVPSPNCSHQVPPNLNVDDTLPAFRMSTFEEAYLQYKDYGWNFVAGNQFITTPFANEADGRLKPAAFQGAYIGYTGLGKWTFEGGWFDAFENRTSSAFTQQTLLTSYPAGGGGVASNINFPGGQGVNTAGFGYGHVGYGSPNAGFSADGYFYGVSDLVTMWWFDGQYVFDQNPFKPFVAFQGGTDINSGLSYIGKVDSQAYGAEIGATVMKNFLLTAGFDEIPWKTDSVYLPAGVTCDNSTYQISVAPGHSLAYFLPEHTATCFTQANGLTEIYYGGWASPYTDNYAADPLYTTNFFEGMVDRRAPGTSYKLAMTYTSTNKRVVFTAADAWYNYGNALGPERTNLWYLDGQYHLNPVRTGPYKGLLLRYRYGQRSLTNTYCGDDGTSCPPTLPSGTTDFGGLPLFKYNRAQLEYDF
jgi:Copper amine oxidase N-terminal domain